MIQEAKLQGERTPSALARASKSMVTAALARLHRNAERSVRVFKHGPDYLDPWCKRSPLASRCTSFTLMTGEHDAAGA